VGKKDDVVEAEQLFFDVRLPREKNGGERIPLYLCLENARFWQDVMGWEPRGKGAVGSALSPRSR